MEQLINYIVVNVADRILAEDVYKITKYDVTIQSGCALTDKRIAELADDTGDNISQRNPSYSELTALYWVWKNQKSKYVGWRHYRRLFAVNEMELEQYMAEGIDVIMPQPMILSDSIEKQYIEASTMDTWIVMLQVLARRHPDYYRAAKAVFKLNVFFPYCMGIWSWEYFDEYCSWLFPILDEVYEVIGEKWDVYQNRYIAFLAERLHSLYFTVNSNKLKYKLVERLFIHSEDSMKDSQDDATEMQALELVEKLLEARQVIRACDLVPNFFEKHTREEWKDLSVILAILYVTWKEMNYTEMTLCHYCTDCKGLTSHYYNIVNYLQILEAGDETQENDIFEYFEKTNLSVWALEQIVDLEINDKKSTFLHLAILYIRHTRIDPAMFFVLKMKSMEMLDEDTVYKLCFELYNVGETITAYNLFMNQT